MIQLSNDALTVSVVDPRSDRDKLGTRYCAGGYIFQVEDSAAGPLLTGPTYPDSFNTFDGQGIPDSFARVPLRDPAALTRGLVVGVGICDLAANEITEPCTWLVELTDKDVTMVAAQELGPYSYEIERRLELRGRCVRSRIRLSNVGDVGFQVSWFPHPFFPHPAEVELFWTNVPITLKPDRGYRMAENGFVCRQDWLPGEDYYLALDHDAQAAAVVLQRHPAVGLVAAACSYIPRFFPIWGNQNTFSWEPYFENTLAARHELTWGIDYIF